jgi:hypothetical protein
VEAQRLLRLERRHVIVGVDTDALTSPYEADMAWTVKLDKPDFIGRSALGRALGRQPKEKLVGFIMQDDGVPEDGSAVVSDGLLAGRVTSCRFSPGKGKRLGSLTPAKAEGRRGGHHTGARTAAARSGDAEGVLRSRWSAPAHVSRRKPSNTRPYITHIDNRARGSRRVKVGTSPPFSRAHRRKQRACATAQVWPM